MFEPTVLVLIGRAMRVATILEPRLDQLGEWAGGLRRFQSATSGGEIADPYRENTACGIFVGKAMLVLLRAVLNPRYRPELTASIDCAESLAPTPLCLAMTYLPPVSDQTRRQRYIT